RPRRAATAGSGAAAAHGGTRERPAGCALAGCRPLPLQLSVLARRRGRARRRTAADLLHPCAARSPHARPLAAPSAFLARRACGCRRSHGARGCRRRTLLSTQRTLRLTGIVLPHRGAPHQIWPSSCRQGCIREARICNSTASTAAVSLPLLPAPQA